MKSVYSVADARGSFSTILDTVLATGMPIILEKHGKPVAKIVAVDVLSTDMIKKYAGMWKNEPWAEKLGKPVRSFRKRNYDKMFA